MKILGIETSCDETSVAVVDGEDRILANVIHSQVPVHRPYGGVVPELASRHHLQHIHSILDRALDDAGATLDDLDGIAVTAGPVWWVACWWGCRSARRWRGQGTCPWWG